MGIHLEDIKKVAIFKHLAGKSLVDTGVEFGLDKYYKNKTGLRNAIHKIYRDISHNPQKYGVELAVVDMVTSAVKARNQTNLGMGSKGGVTPDNAPINETDIKSLLTKGRNKAVKLLQLKLDDLENHPKKLAKENIVSLAKVAGILFDKAQIIQGEATEHVAILSKVKDDMKPEEAYATLLRMREGLMEEKYA